MKIGLKARFSDLDEVLKLSPEFVELQFSDLDVDYAFKPKKKYPLPAMIHLPELWHGYLIDIASIRDENQVLPLKESRTILQKIITKSERFFTHFTNEHNIFILHPGGMTFERDYPKNNKYRLEALLESLSLVKTHNSEILVENLPPYPWYFGGQWDSNLFMDAEEIEKFCKTTGRKICYDISHSKLYCNFAHKDFMEQLEIFKRSIGHIHIADAVGLEGEGIQIDEGEIDFAKVFRALKDYDGTIVNEVWRGHADNFVGFRVAMKKIKKYLSQ